MATYTDYFGLTRPAGGENVSRQVINQNTTKIDLVMHQNRQMSANAYDQSETYNEGNLIIYEDVLYRCLEDGVTGNWNANKWVATTLADEVAQGGGGDSANQNIADDYDPTQTYAVGDYVIHDSMLYKCTTAVAVAEAWDSTKWTSCVVTDEMGGGGTTVVANPSGEATDELEKIQIGETIYEIVGGGGGGIETVFEGTKSTSSWANPLVFDSFSLSDYTKLIIDATYRGTPYQWVIDVEDIPEATSGGSGTGQVYGEVYHGNVDDTYYMWVSTGYNLVVSKIQGISKGGGNSHEKELSYAEYLALPEADKTNGTNYYIYDINGDGSDFQPMIYSEDEREIGVWTDGKPLYQRTWTFSSTYEISPNSWVTTSISNAVIEKCIDCVGISPSGAVWGFLGATGDTGSYINILNARQTAIEVKSLTLRYTKTTDAPGSGTWTPQGVPAVHYSTDEQVVGTWIDGSTLYEKTYSWTLPNNNNYTSKSLNLPNDVNNAWVNLSGSYATGASGSSVFRSPWQGYQSSATEMDAKGFFQCANGDWRWDYRVGSYMYGGTGVLTIQYTKSAT